MQAEALAQGYAPFAYVVGKGQGGVGEFAGVATPPVGLGVLVLLAVDAGGEDLLADDGRADVADLGDELLEQIRLGAEVTAGTPWRCELAR